MLSRKPGFLIVPGGVRHGINYTEKKHVAHLPYGTVPARTDSEDSFCSGCRNLGKQELENWFLLEIKTT